jgi:hypothetical protein
VKGIPRERESKVQRAIMVRLSRLGVRLWRRNVGAMADRKGNYVRFAAPGQSDLWGVDRSGRHWEVEVKRHGNRPTDRQISWLKEMTNRGAVAYWADCPNIAERVAEAVLRGGRIAWRDGVDFDVEKEI